MLTDKIIKYFLKQTAFPPNKKNQTFYKLTHKIVKYFFKETLFPPNKKNQIYYNNQRIRPNKVAEYFLRQKVNGGLELTER